MIGLGGKRLVKKEYGVGIETLVQLMKALLIEGLSRAFAEAEDKRDPMNVAQA